MKNDLGGIYRILNLKNGRFYIGSTTSFKRRWNDHINLLRKGAHHNKFLSRDFLKCNESSFRFEILEEISDVSSLRKIEQQYLERLFDNGVLCYNLHAQAIGGNLIIWSGKAKKEFSRIRKGNGNPMFGRKHSQETKRLMAMRQYKKVCQYRLDGTLLNTFKSIEEAGQAAGVTRQMIGHCCHGNRKTGKGFIWRFENEQ